MRLLHDYVYLVLHGIGELIRTLWLSRCAFVVMAHASSVQSFVSKHSKNYVLSLLFKVAVYSGLC